ncbi:cell division protein ZapA [Fulvimarina endophytica]|uniref:Cell division protein ZapA n=1 Tax=Fulvimarina endophytica TaxID=2293836 RepID=A0A371X0T9_9HYPH|nr:cell division protein ZapA [Fulvimarina endophytica]RFC62825.1 cell division protein ZapA [Fulvimarina endophytica]
MPQVVVEIDGKTYRMACGPGEEDHLQDLAAGIEEKIASLKDGVGQIGDQRLTIMAAIMTADELSDVRLRLNVLEKENERLRSEARRLEATLADIRSRFTHAINGAADIIEGFARRLS